jgi:formylglycine-generating enzyme required for sulfatase activity
LLAAAAALPQLWPTKVPDPPRRPVKSSKDLEIERRLEEERQQRAAAEERQRQLEEELQNLKARQEQESTAAREAEIQKKAAELAAAQLMAREQEQARQRAEAERIARRADETITLGTPFYISGLGVLSWIPEGEFIMGSSDTERRVLAARKDWKPETVADEQAHRVRISQGFWLGADEITLEQFLSFLNDTAAQPASVYSSTQPWVVKNNPCCPIEYTSTGWRMRSAGGDAAAFWSSPRQPMICVTWYGARAFCQWFTRSAAQTGKLPAGWVFTLPTEAQWERACRGDTPTMFSFGNSISSALANFDSMQPIGSALPSRSLGHTHATAAPRLSQAAAGAEVRVLRSRAAMTALDPAASAHFPQDHPWWLKDMHGNVWEWCLDWYGEYDTPPLSTDPLGQSKGTGRVMRGGSWKSPGWACRSAVRNYAPPAGGEGDEEIGFRVALVREAP